MYVEGIDKKRGILFVEDNFASLEKIDPLNDAITNINKDLHFKFYFKVSQTKAIQEGCFSVVVTLRSANKQIPVIVPNVRNGEINTETLLDNILTNKQKIKNQSIQDETFIVSEKTADISSRIDNKFLTSLRSGAIDESQFGKTKVIVRKKRNVQDIDTSFDKNGLNNRVLTRTAFGDLAMLKSTPKLEPEAIKKRFKLLNSLIPPSSVTSVSNKTITPYSSLTGCVNTLQKNNFRNSLLDSLSYFHHTFDIQDEKTQKDRNDYETIIEQKFDDLININVDFVLKQSYMYQPFFIVEFKLVKRIVDSRKQVQQIVIETVEKKLDVKSHYDEFLFNDYKPLSVGVSKKGQEVFLQICNPNEGACSAEIYGKHIKNFNESSFYKVGSLVFDSKNQIAFKKLIDNDIDSIYRVVASNIRNGNLSNDFTDVVVKNPRKITNNEVIVIPQLGSGKINLTVINNSYNSGIIACKILYRNVTKKENSYQISQILNFSEQKQQSILITSALIPYNDYEITTKLIYENGVEIFSQNSNLIKYIPYLGNVSTTQATNVVTSTGFNVTFDLNASLEQSELSQINDLLASVSTVFDTEYYDSKISEYEKFIAFQIFRYNKLDGSCSDLGILSNNSSFSDVDQSNLRGISPAIQGGKYRYVVYPLLRDPETILQTKKELIDQETKKKYTANIRKHKHPLTLMRGSVLSKSKIDNDTVPDMLYGMIGNSIHIDVDVGINQFPMIKNFVANQINNKKVILTWNIEGDIKKFDHILVLKDEGGIKTLIGKTHCLQQEFKFGYDLSSDDIGNIRFVLTPILQDYSTGRSIMSDYVLVNDVE
jgi:hypothetical protein